MMRIGSEQRGTSVPLCHLELARDSASGKPITARPRSTARLRRQRRDRHDNITCCRTLLTSQSSPWVNYVFWMNFWENLDGRHLRTSLADTCRWYAP